MKRFNISFLVILALTLLSCDLHAVTNLSPPSVFPVITPPSVVAVNGNSNLSANDWASIIQALAAIANLAFIVWLFCFTNKQHFCERQQDFKNRETERKARVAGFWIEELIMRQHHSFIHEFFEDFEERLKSPQAPKGSATRKVMLQMASAQILEFKAQLHKIQQQVIDPLLWINDDFNALLPIRNEIEDLVTGELKKIPGIDTSNNKGAENLDPEYKLGELRKDFFQTIHRVQTKVLLNSTYQ